MIMLGKVEKKQMRKFVIICQIQLYRNTLIHVLVTSTVNLEQPRITHEESLHGKFLGQVDLWGIILIFK